MQAFIDKVQHEDNNSDKQCLKITNILTFEGKQKMLHVSILQINNEIILNNLPQL